ncbi:MAG: thioesterase family protein [Solirubrobacterales bacterium]|nr:thioesterase family protein [Solirubrobacterales bacterium]
MTDFETDTAAIEIAPGRSRVELNDRWWIGPGPNGGYVAALMLQAMSEMVAEATEGANVQPPRSLSVHFLSAPSVGEAEVAVEIERQGHSTTFISARLIQDGETEAKAMAVFSAERQGPSFNHSKMPSVPSPEGGLELDTAQAPVAVFTQYRAVPVIGGSAFGGGPRAETGGWMKLKDEQPMTAVLAAAMLDVWFPAPFVTLTERVFAPTLEYTVHFPRELPVPGSEAADWVLVRLMTDEAHDGHFSEDGELWSRDGTLLARCRQVALLRSPKP